LPTSASFEEIAQDIDSGIRRSSSAPQEVVAVHIAAATRSRPGPVNSPLFMSMPAPPWRTI